MRFSVAFRGSLLGTNLQQVQTSEVVKFCFFCQHGAVQALGGSFKGPLRVLQLKGPLKGPFWDNYEGSPVLELWTARTRNLWEPQVPDLDPCKLSPLPTFWAQNLLKLSPFNMV